MDDPLSKYLGEIAQAAAAEPTFLAPSTLRAALDSEDESTAATAQACLFELSKPLTDLLTSDPRFPGAEVRLLRGESGATGFYPNFVGQMLARRVAVSGDCVKAIAWLQKVLLTTSAAGTSITAIWGVPVKDAVSLTPAVSLIPISEIPDSPQKQWLSSGQFAGLQSGFPSAFHLEQPSSALVSRVVITPLMVPPEMSLEASNNEYIERYEQFREIALALTVVGPRISLAAAHWFTFDDPDIQHASLSGAGRNQSLIEIMPKMPTDYPPLEPDEASALVKGYLQLQGDARDKVRLSLNRLNQAQRRHNVGDQAVELCTALEAILGDGQTTEMTHKVRVRGARMLGGEATSRRRNATIIGKAYDIRSALVHTGRVDEGKKYILGDEVLTQEQIIDEAVLLVASLIRVVIQEGSIPKWPQFDVS